MKKIAELTIERNDNGRYSLKLVQGRRTTVLDGSIWTEVKTVLNTITPGIGALSEDKVSKHHANPQLMQQCFTGFSGLVLVPEAFGPDGQSLGVVFLAPSNFPAAPETNPRPQPR